MTRSLSTLILVAVAIASTRARAEDAPKSAAHEAGAKIYAEQCSSCHGAKGEGVRRKYSRPLRGDRSIAQLTRYIEESMPEDDEDECVGDDAKNVARFIHDAFYSPIAQARLAPPRVELSRLTVGQYRNAVADLVTSFRARGTRPTLLAKENGLQANYFNERRPRGKAALRRRDGRVDFDFGAKNPSPGKVDDHGFAARWEGSVLAPETGVYEFVVHTDHAIHLWVNDLDESLIDAWVKSGSGTEFRASVFLVGGRAYPMRLEFTSRDQGVNKKKKPKKVNAFLRLEWKRPGRIAEVIRARFLRPDRAAESYVVDTPFPPDDRSEGFERGSSISKAWDDATTSAALRTADYVVEHLSELSGARPKDKNREKRVRDFCERWLERAFRGKLTDAQRELYLDRRFEGAPSLELAVKRVVLLSLKSPRFLFVDAKRVSVAELLAFALWDSIPDEKLNQALERGQLEKPEDIERTAERMLADERARHKLRRFFDHYLDLEASKDLSMDPAKFPNFDEQVIADLRSSLELFVDSIVWSQNSDFRELLRSRDLFVSPRLAEYYGYPKQDNLRPGVFRRLEAKSDARAGALSHPYVLARFAYRDTTSPIHRGVFVARHLLGRSLRPPPEAFSPFAADLHPKLTTRERVELQTKPDACRGCHGLVNPLGFPLETFDADGSYRARDGEREIDDSGTYELPSGTIAEFRGARALAEFLAEHAGTHRSFVLQLFEHLVKQRAAAFDPALPERLQEGFTEGKFSIRKLMVRIAREVATTRKPSERPGETTP